jgi:hypothetical protein
MLSMRWQDPTVDARRHAAVDGKKQEVRFQIPDTSTGHPCRVGSTDRYR